MERASEAWLASALGLILAGGVVAIVMGLLHLTRAIRRLLRTPAAEARLAVEKLRGLRLRRMRAAARAEGERAAEAIAEVRRLRLELRRVRAERDVALARLAEAPRPRAWFEGTEDDRFQRAKRAFARRFHPDHAPGDAGERRLRARLFREFWQELRQIERG